MKNRIVNEDKAAEAVKDMLKSLELSEIDCILLLIQAFKTFGAYYSRVASVDKLQEEMKSGAEQQRVAFKVAVILSAIVSRLGEIGEIEETGNVEE